MWYKQKCCYRARMWFLIFSYILSKGLLISNTLTILFCLVDCPSVKEPKQSTSPQAFKNVTSFLNLYISEKELCELFRVGITNPMKQDFIAFNQFN